MNISRADARRIIDRSCSYDLPLSDYLEKHNAIRYNAMYRIWECNVLVDYKAILLAYGLDNIDEDCFLYTKCGERVLAKRGIDINTLY